jgi:hypothetical protein
VYLGNSPDASRNMSRIMNALGSVPSPSLLLSYQSNCKNLSRLGLTPHVGVSMLFALYRVAHDQSFSQSKWKAMALR